MLFAFSIASAGVRKVSTDSTGPKISSRAMRCAWETPVKIVGANQKPRSGRSHGGDQMSAPSAVPMSESSRIRASCAAELIAPTSVFLSSGSPTRSCAIRRFSDSSTSSAIDSCTQQPGTGAADVALVEEDAVDDALDGLVDRRVFEDDVRRLAAEFEREPFARAGDRLRDGPADLGRAGERDLVDAGVLDQQPAGVAGAGDDVDDARRQVGLLADLGEQSAVSGVVSAGFSTTVLPHASAGAIFHASISSGKFHGMTCAGDADRLRVGAETRVPELVGPARVVEEVRRDQRDVDVARLPDRLAVVDRLQHRQLPGALGDDARDAEQVFRARRRRASGPTPSRKAARRRGDGSVYIGRTGVDDLGEGLLGGRVDRLERRAVCRLDELTADEQAVARLDVDDGAGFRSGCVIEMPSCQSNVT